MAYDIGGRGDKSFNDAAAAGLDKAKKDFGVQSKELSAVAGETDAQKQARLELLAQGGYNPVIAVGFAYAAAVKNVVPKYPNTNFAIIDDSSFTAPNIGPMSAVDACAAAMRTQPSGTPASSAEPILAPFARSG